MDDYQQPVVNVLGVTAIHLPAGEGRVVVPVSARKEREVLSMLALRLRKTVSADQLIDALWGSDPPRAAATTLQGYVAHIRRGLEPHRVPRTPAQVLRTTDYGYLLDLPDTHVDAHDFSHRAAAALAAWPQVLGPRPKVEVQAEAGWQTIADLESALALWQGVAYADLGNHDHTVEAERARLNELYVSVVELVAGLRIALDKPVPAIASLGQLVVEYPLRESLSVQLALALARAGRQSDALAALHRLAGSLREELGLDLSLPARQLREAILRQDPEWGLGVAGNANPGEDAPSDEIVGRNVELSRVSSELDRVVGGEGRVIVLTGELGAGKSRLAQEVARRAQQRAMTVVRVNVPEGPTTPPLWPIQQLVEKLGAHLRTRALPVPSGTLSDDQRFYYLHEVLALVREASAQAPLMIKVTGLQWCDLDTLRVLRALVDETSTMSLALVLSRRPGPAPFGSRSGLGAALARGGTLHVNLTGIGARDVVRLARLSAGLELTGREGEELRRRTDGNPYFVIELARTGKPLGDELPETLVAVIEAELAALPAGVQDVLRVSAVIGLTFEVEVLEQVVGLETEELADLLEMASAARFIRPNDRGYTFRRLLVREVLVRTCPTSQRAHIHAEIARYLDERYLLGEEPDVGGRRFALAPSRSAAQWTRLASHPTGRAADS